ncbi:MAG: hypothetical protein DI585_01995 [Pseudomonas fluorescens]|nr:MAG: hypothetical protein DI585_01995 [Pseudomonas fluorescens]
MRFSRVFLLTLAATSAGVAQAEPIRIMDGILTPTVTVASDYVFRGISQNDENITPMIGSTWAHKSGVHVDLFAAPVNFRTANDDANAEIDAGVGYTHAFSNKLTGDASIVAYLYPGSNSNADYNYFEGIGSLTYDWGVASTTGLVAYSPDFTGVGTDEAVFVEGSAAAPFSIKGYDFKAVGGLARQMVDNGLDYTTWRVGVSYNLMGFTVAATYHDTDIEKSQCDDICGARGVLSVAYTF